jgi:predicted nucleic acid-binding protein
VAQRRLAELAGISTTFWISRQVLREFLAVTTRPGFLAPLPPAEFLVKTVSYFETRFRIAVDDSEVTAGLLDLMCNPGVQGKQVHDANIVATMRRHQISYLLTHNTADFQRYSPCITVLPLVP